MKARNRRLREITNLHLNSDKQTFTLLANFTSLCLLQRETLETGECARSLQGAAPSEYTESAQEQGLLMASLHRIRAKVFVTSFRGGIHSCCGGDMLTSFLQRTRQQRLLPQPKVPISLGDTISALTTTLDFNQICREKLLLLATAQVKYHKWESDCKWVRATKLSRLNLPLKYP